nr:DEAD/DEAH box helicase family protein [Halalkalicoccus sp. NIPERK01]
MGHPVVTAEEVARVLDCTQEEADRRLSELAETGGVGRRNVERDPVVFYPAEWDQQARRERVVTFPNRRELVVSHPEQFTRARLSTFAHLVDSNSAGDALYRIREEDIWGAPYDDLADLLVALRRVTGERHEALEEWITSQWKRARQFTLRTHEDGYTVLEASSESLMGNVARQVLDESHLHAPISDTESWVREGSEAEIKRILYDEGYPVRDARDLDTGDPLEVDLSLELRDYQREWVERFVERKAGVLVGPPGSGKTVAGMGAMAAVGGETLVLVPSRELAAQWRESLLANTSLDESRIGEYHGGEKEIRPVTIATYQTAGMDRHRRLFDERRWGLILYDECLSGDTVVETSDGKTTFEALDAKYEFDDGWNEEVDLTVRTYDLEHETYQWDSVTGVYRTSAPVQRITTNTGRRLKATEGHTHLVFDPKTCEIHEQQGLREGDYLVQPLSEPTARPADTATAVDLARAELLGWFIGDGHLNRYDDVKFSFSRRSNEQIAILTQLCDSLGATYSTFENARGDRTLWIPKLRETLDWQGPSGNKTTTVSVPDESYVWSEDRIGALLRGLFDAEGSIDPKGRIEFDTTSEQLATDVSLLLQKVGIMVRRHTLERESPRHNTIHRLYVPSFYGPRFRERVGFRFDHKSNRLTDGDTPATGLPVGPFLSAVKDDLRLTGSELGSMMDISRTTVDDVIRGKYQLGQRNLHALTDGLAQYADETAADAATARKQYNITFERLATAMDVSLGTAHRQFGSKTSAARDAVAEIVVSRQKRAVEYVRRLKELTNVNVLRVDDIEEIGTETVYDFETESHTFLANGILTHNCHHIPAPIFRQSADLQSKHRLGLSATPVRESDDEAEIFTLIGPPIGTDWSALFEAGYVMEPDVEIRYVPWASEAAESEYASALGHERRQVAASNPAKLAEIRRLLEDHAEEKVLIFVDWLEQGEEYAEALDIPFLSGETRYAKRERLLSEFRHGTRDVLLVSRVGDEGIDLPAATVAIVASGLGGSRRQGAQRAGRTMRPVGGAQVYVLATRGTEEEEFARGQMRHLQQKGVNVLETDAETA